MTSMKTRIAALAAAFAIALGTGALVAAPASASGTCGFYATDHSHNLARSYVDTGGLCGPQKVSARYPVGVGTTYAGYGNAPSIYQGEYVATSLPVPSGKSVVGSKSNLKYYGNWTTWVRTH